YMLIANSLDSLKQPDHAIQVYQAGIQQFPHDARLHYNLGITQIGLKRMSDAKRSFEEAVTADPNHASGHLGLGQAFKALGYKVPAVMALSRFLILEANSPRSSIALQSLTEIMQSGARKDADGKLIIAADESQNLDEGDFNAAALALSLTAAGRLAEATKDKSEMQIRISSFEALIAILATANPEQKQGGFSWNYYRPYFVELR